MIAVSLGEGTPPWYCSCRRFYSATGAATAFERIFNHDSSLGVGVYRHQRVGLDREAMLVSVVGLDPEGVRKAEELLGGEATRLDPENWHDLILRRMKVVNALSQAGEKKGRYRIEHSKNGDPL